MSSSYLALFLVLIIACSTRSVHKESSKGFGKYDTDFARFFASFKSDSSFQVSRVKFPFFNKIWEAGEEVSRTTWVEPDEWRFLNFHYDSSYATRQLDAYTQQYKTYGDTVRVELRGVDNGIYIDYIFVQDGGRWFLTGEEDFSN